MGVGKREKSRQKSDGAHSLSNVTKVKGSNFYRDAKKLRHLNLLKSGAPTRNADGQIIKAADFQSKLASGTVARVDPNRKWFENTRTITQDSLTAFRTAMTTHLANPYSFVVRQNTLPMSLLNDSAAAKQSRVHVLETEPFGETFSAGRRRKRVKLGTGSFEEMVEGVEKAQDSYSSTTDQALLALDTPDSTPTARDPIFSKGTSKRIWSELHKVIDSSDVLCMVLDARDPEGTRCKAVEKRLKKEAPHKHVVFVLNKCDLVPTWVTARWVKILSTEYPTLAFHASLKNAFGKGDLIALLRQFAKLHADKKQISVGFIGYPNAGKSSIINALRSQKACTVAPIPGETKIWQYITLTKRIYLIDCPGIVPPGADMTDADLVLRGVVRVENVEMPEQYVDAVVARCGKGYLEKTYGVQGWNSAEEFLEMVAKKGGKLLKGGEPDLPTVAKMVLNDWLRGKIPFFTAPPGSTVGKPAVIENRAAVEEGKTTTEASEEGKAEEADSEVASTPGIPIKQHFAKIRVTVEYTTEDRKTPYGEEEEESADGDEKQTEGTKEEGDVNSEEGEEDAREEPSWEELLGAVKGEGKSEETKDAAPKGKSAAGGKEKEVEPAFDPKLVDGAIAWAEEELEGEDESEEEAPAEPLKDVKDVIAVEAEAFLAKVIQPGVKPPGRSRAPVFVVKDEEHVKVEAPAPAVETAAGVKRKGGAGGKTEDAAPPSKRRNVRAPAATKPPSVTPVEEEPDSELELSDKDADSDASDDEGAESHASKEKEKRKTTNKKKVGTHYYETANVKNRNRAKKQPSRAAKGSPKADTAAKKDSKGRRK
ncbi:NGP1NT-domain-containing protein [Gonapodya prolifera JEL478]|uniref:Nucleolar GTP-binding protein 2 n=1 Tax=Gonapodya prolifera (strain JEL478) TaxID=1344416 RepID=A0A139A0Q8_GONPJ|nr:NGP1NT-domain-containing protein [Gonapodya prolifera JEL478]|eukprot:KXS10208.1 NGP1NT-domain-containing protein [Gonapodya prolifera JEL478]